MGAYAAVLLLLVVVIVVGSSPAKEKYTNQYDNMDVDKILGNDRLYARYKDCLLEKGVCPPPAKMLKENLKEVLHTNCERCTDVQKKLLKKGIAYVHDKHPEDLRMVVEHYGSKDDNVDELLQRLETEWQ